LSNGEPSTVDHIVDELYSGLLDGEAWRRALIAAADLVGGSGVTLFASDPRTGRVLHDESHRMDAALVAEHRSGWDMRDPHFGLTPTAPLQVPAYESRMRRTHESRSTPHVLATWLHRAPERAVFLTIQAPPRRDPFNEANAQALQRVTRHIARALELRDQLGLLNARVNALADPDLPADTPLQTLRNLFGLSEREAEVATLIASGMRPAAAAAQMGITLNTARTHLKHVFQKSGATSQAELVRLVLRHSQGTAGA
jgi:DNA-binding CsgD family transcriptional regulator